MSGYIIAGIVLFIAGMFVLPIFLDALNPDNKRDTDDRPHGDTGGWKP